MQALSTEQSGTSRIYQCSRAYSLRLRFRKVPDLMLVMPRPAQAGRAAAGRAVRAWRADRTQQEIAAQAGINADTLSDLESGSKWPRNKTLRAVEEALDRAPGELDEIAWEADHSPAASVSRSPPRDALVEHFGARKARLIRREARAFPDGGSQFLSNVEDALRRLAPEEGEDDDGDG